MGPLHGPCAGTLVDVTLQEFWESSAVSPTRRNSNYLFKTPRSVGYNELDLMSTRTVSRRLSSRLTVLVSNGPVRESGVAAGMAHGKVILQWGEGIPKGFALARSRP